MYVFAPMPRDQHSPMLFNVDAVVGNRGTNLPEDVYLVQFLLRKVGQRVPATRGVNRTPRYLAVPLSGRCDAATIDGIRASQEDMRETMPGTVVDGRISPARSLYYGGGVWTIVALNGFIRAHCPEAWPRLQDFDDCPGPLKEAVKRSL
jgi:hypothetical protein